AYLDNYNESGHAGASQLNPSTRVAIYHRGYSTVSGVHDYRPYFVASDYGNGSTYAIGSKCDLNLIELDRMDYIYTYIRNILKSNYVREDLVSSTVIAPASNTGAVTFMPDPVEAEPQKIFTINLVEDNYLEFDLLDFAKDDQDAKEDLIWSVSDVAKAAMDVWVKPGTSLLAVKPKKNFVGQDTVIVTVEDSDGLTDSQDVLINVQAVNDPPAIRPAIGDSEMEEKVNLSLYGANKEYYGYDIVDARLRIVAIDPEPTLVEVYNINQGIVVASATLNQYEVWNPEDGFGNELPGDGIYFKVTGDKPFVAYLSDFIWGHSTYLPGANGSAVDTLFRTYVFYTGFRIFSGIEDARVTIRDTAANTLYDNIKVPKDTAFEPGLPEGVYEISSDQPILCGVFDGKSITSVPDCTTGNETGQKFMTAINGWATGAMLIFGYEESNVKIFRIKDTGLEEVDYSSTDIVNELGQPCANLQSIGKGSYRFITNLNTDKFLIESDAEISVWAGDTNGGFTVNDFGDGILYTIGKKSVDPITLVETYNLLFHTLGGEGVVFGLLDQTTIELTDKSVTPPISSTYTLNKDDTIPFNPEKFYSLKSDKPILVFINGAASGLVDEGATLVPIDRFEVLTRPSWWDAGWKFRIAAKVKTGQKDLSSLDITQDINFTTHLVNLGYFEEFDENSVRVVEYNGENGDVIGAPNTVTLNTPSEETEISKITCSGIDDEQSAGAVATDGTYLYVKRWASYAGPNNIQKIGSGFNGTKPGKWYGEVNCYAWPTINLTYHGDGCLYVAYTHQTQLQKINPATDSYEWIHTAIPMLERYWGTPINGWKLITSDGNLIYNLSYDRYTFFKYRIFDPADGWKCIKEVQTAIPSYYVDGLLCDGKYLYPIQWTNNNRAKITKIEIETGEFKGEWSINQGDTHAISGQYDWVNNVFYIGSLYDNNVYRYMGRHEYDDFGSFIPDSSFVSYPTPDEISEGKGATGQVSWTLSPDVDIEKDIALPVLGAGVCATDGKYAYVKRWSSAPGNETFSMIGTGHTVAGISYELGKNYGSLPTPASRSLCAFYHKHANGDEFIYNPGTHIKLVERINLATHDTEMVEFTSGLIGRHWGYPNNGWKLLTSNGTYFYGLSYNKYDYFS
ncbi:hypothetical protein KAJ27_21155, partial [bacterium]|nr:hypothetical protein [bacterium]